TREGLVGTLEYSTSLFNDETIARMLGHYRNLLEAIIAAPGERLQALPMLSAEERGLLLQQWNHAPQPEPGAGLAHAAPRSPPRSSLRSSSGRRGPARPRPSPSRAVPSR